MQGKREARALPRLRKLSLLLALLVLQLLPVTRLKVCFNWVAAFGEWEDASV